MWYKQITKALFVLSAYGIWLKFKMQKFQRGIYIFTWKLETCILY